LPPALESSDHVASYGSNACGQGLLTVQKEERNLKAFGMVRAGAAVAAAGALLTCASAAQAQRPPSLGAGAPSGQMGVQLYDWSQYISNGAGELNPPVPSAQDARVERVFQFLQSRGVKLVELYGYNGTLFPNTTAGNTGNIAGLQALRALGDKYGLRFPSRHGNIAEANWDNDIAASKILGQEYIGAADLPGDYNRSYAATLDVAQRLNRLGKRSVEAGLGPVYWHNHAHEFTNKWMDNGVLKSAEEIVLDRTDPRYVKAQIDIFWAISGGADVTAFVNRYQDRLVSYHVKDGVNPNPGANSSNLRALGQGVVDFGPIFAASKNRVKYYLYEYDPVTIGSNGGFNPFTSADTSFAALKSDPAPVLYAPPTSFPTVPAGTAAATNVVAITVTNVGDAPLTFANNPMSIQADTNDGGAATAADFSVVSHNCTTALAPAKAAVADNPSTPADETAPAVPAGTCVVNVGFKPTRTNYTSIARLQINSNSDDAVESVPLYGKSTGDSLVTVGGDVPSLLNLQLSTPAASFGTFVPTIARAYETALSATVTTTTGNAALSVSDPGTSAPGHLVNGAFALPQPLNVRAGNAASPNAAFVPLAEAIGQPTQLLGYSAPTTSDVVTLGFRQNIGGGDALRAGTYGKQLTFTLSTTTP
jgi:sugar phosphate isomerase/epimerase